MTGLELLKCLSEAATDTRVGGDGSWRRASRYSCPSSWGPQDYVVKDSHLEFLEELPRRVEEAIHRHRLGAKSSATPHNRWASRTRWNTHQWIGKGQLVEVNPALEAQTGYNRGELLGQTPRLFKSGKHESEFYRDMWQTILNRQSWQGELTNRRKDGAPEFDDDLAGSRPSGTHDAFRVYSARHN
ncbi:MAG UNVERIFIED_CONTAM: PAS domain S-box protein [Microcystis novacekii LVE1205-3]|jgi:PAS domain-containing protein